MTPKTVSSGRFYASAAVASGYVFPTGEVTIDAGRRAKAALAEPKAGGTCSQCGHMHEKLVDGRCLRCGAKAGGECPECESEMKGGPIRGYHTCAGDEPKAGGEP